MCNHFRRDPEYRDRAGEFSDLKIPLFRDRGRLNSVKEHVYPGRDGEILMVEDGALTNAAAHWRFVPFHWKGSLKEWAEPSKPGAILGLSCNNARGETADTQPQSSQRTSLTGTCARDAPPMSRLSGLLERVASRREPQSGKQTSGALWALALLADVEDDSSGWNSDLARCTGSLECAPVLHASVAIEAITPFSASLSPGHGRLSRCKLVRRHLGLQGV
jgi:hypothetical protein